MAVESAVHYPRFRPVSAEELDAITIEISVYLTGLSPIRPADEFVPGEDGIILIDGGPASKRRVWFYCWPYPYAKRPD
jgi:AMMECR1 domain-containing protein